MNYMMLHCSYSLDASSEPFFFQVTRNSNPRHMLLCTATKRTNGEIQAQMIIFSNVHIKHYIGVFMIIIQTKHH